MLPKPLPLRFYRRDTTLVARELLGKVLWREKNGILTSGIIIETEAYLGLNDPACHTYGGRQTHRVASMYLNGGHSYVYFVYGMHYCFNVVTQCSAVPEAVLIRALWPVLGEKAMRTRRKITQRSNWCSGPGKLCQAMAIDRTCDGLLLDSAKLFISNGIPFQKVQNDIQSSPRIGVGHAKHAKNWPLRFYLNAGSWP